MRCFVAIGVPDDVRERLRRALEPLRERHDVRWTRPDGWHVTVAFCGQVDDDATSEIEWAVASAVASPRGDDPGRADDLHVRIGAAARFGGHALALEVVDEPPGSLTELGARVQNAIHDAGLPVERRRVAGHLTVARSRGGLPQQLTADVDEAVGSTDSLAFAVRRLGVWRSHLGHGPARYEELASVTLGS